MTWPASVKWPSGNPPTLTSTANATDTVSFIFDGTNYLGSYLLNYLAFAPTYATLNPSDKGTAVSLSNGNLTASVGSGSNWSAVRSTIGKSSGKWYWEVTQNALSSVDVGVMTSGCSLDGAGTLIGNCSTGWTYINGGNKAHNGFSVSYGASYATNDVIGVALDMDAGTVTFYKNGASQGQAYTGLTGTVYAAVDQATNESDQQTINFGATSFAETVPAGYCAGLANICP